MTATPVAQEVAQRQSEQSRPGRRRRRSGKRPLSITVTDAVTQTDPAVYRTSLTSFGHTKGSPQVPVSLSRARLRGGSSPTAAATAAAVTARSSAPAFPSNSGDGGRSGGEVGRGGESRSMRNRAPLRVRPNCVTRSASDRS